MSQVRSFAPWIAYAAISSFAGWNVAAPIALVLAARVAYLAVDDLSRATACFFAVITPVALIAPDSLVHRYVPALALATLGLAAGASLVRGRPFTEAYAKRSVAPELWSTSLFRQANVTITSVWTASFFLTAAAAIALAVAPHAVILLAGVQALGVLVPLRFTRIYRARVRARVAMAATPVAA